MVEYGGTFAGAYFLRRALFLPFELEECLNPDLLRDGFATLSPRARLNSLTAPDPGSDFGRVSALETGHYMRNQLLRDADWAGMAHGLEIRTPFVDVAMLAAIAPIAPRLTGRAGKLALAAAPSRPLPDIVARRAKTGFTLPTSRWMSAAAQAPAQAGLASRAWAAHVMQAHTESQARL
jgi:asparagine synthase (glutamine-hydrolysing)